MGNRGDWGIRMLEITLGLFILLRTVNKDSHGKTLVNHLGVPSPLTPQQRQLNAAGRQVASSDIGGSSGPFGIFGTVRTLADRLGIAGSVTTTNVPLPTALTRTLPDAIRAGNRQAAVQAWNASVSALQNGTSGHGDVGAALVLKDNGLYSAFSKLTGSSVSGF